MILSMTYHQVVLLEFEISGIYPGRSEKCSLMVQWVVRSILHGGAISHSTQYSMTGIASGMCYPVCGMVHIQERVVHVAPAGFLSRCLSGPLLYLSTYLNNYLSTCQSIYPSTSI